MDFLQAILNEDYDAVLGQLTADCVLDLQSVGTARGQAEAGALLRKQRDYLKDQVASPKVFRQFADAGCAVTEYDIALQNGYDLPLVLVSAKAPDYASSGHFSALRSYHSVYPITGGHEFRAALFTERIQLREPPAVVEYFRSIAVGSTEKTMATLSFADDVYFREPAGWRWKHSGKDGLRKHFDHFFADGGVPLKFHSYVYDAETGVFAGEYSCDEWGQAKFKAQAGISIYDIHPDTGKITGVRVYDNVDPAYA